MIADTVRLGKNVVDSASGSGQPLWLLASATDRGSAPSSRSSAAPSIGRHCKISSHTLHLRRRHARRRRLHRPRRDVHQRPLSARGDADGQLQTDADWTLVADARQGGRLDRQQRDDSRGRDDRRRRAGRRRRRRHAGCAALHDRGRRAGAGHRVAYRCRTGRSS